MKSEIAKFARQSSASVSTDGSTDDATGRRPGASVAVESSPSTPDRREMGPRGRPHRNAVATLERPLMSCRRNNLFFGTPAEALDVVLKNLKIIQNVDKYYRYSDT